MQSPSLRELSRSRTNNFDFLRFLMACIVIYTHSFRISGALYSSGKQRLLHGDFGGATLAVDVFFLISGFLISSSFQNSATTLHYLQKRLLRIYPGFIAALAFCVFIVGPLAGVDRHTYFTSRGTYAFFLPILWAPLQVLPGAFSAAHWESAVNSSLWTIRFELFCYFLPPLLGLFGLFRPRGVILALFIAAICAHNLEAHQLPFQWKMFLPWFGDVWELPRFMMYFLAGMTYFAWRDHIRLTLPALALASAGALIGFATPLKDILLPLALPYLIFYIAFSPRIPFQRFGKHGDFSYGMYLYAFPIQQLLVRYLPLDHKPFVLTFLAGIATFAAAFLSWRLIEKPCLQLKNRGHAAHPSAHEPAPIPAATT